VTVCAVGVGASGADARSRVDDACATIARLPRCIVVGRSRSYENPPWGGATRAPFVNAAVVVRTPWPPRALLGILLHVEREAGRVRAQKNAARTLDLDVLWSSMPVPTSSSPLLPHPRLLARAFAVVPLVEALDDARVVVPLALREAARRHGCAPLRAAPSPG
jgi:2-amino-4-hydroxy-6-hydroxymethyldihydropteridine diphosphokinase